MTDNSTATSAPGSSLLPEGTAALTTIHLVLIAILAIVVVIGIVWGIRQKRARVQAKQDLVSHAQEAGVPPVATRDIAPPPAPAPAPISPAPPPIADEPVAGTRVAPAPLADEPIAAAAPLDASPASEASAPVPVASSDADGPVTQLKGLGPKVAARLNELGVTTVGQIAALDDASAQTLDAQLGSFAGRMARDRWIEQARYLASGDRAGFEAVFGKL